MCAIAASNSILRSGSRFEVAMGAALAVRREVVEQMQGLDPRFFMYFEEADLCRRIHDAGYGLAYSPVPVVPCRRCKLQEEQGQDDAGHPPEYVQVFSQA